MLKEPRKFYSVNSHNNLAPTITSMVLNNFRMPYAPQEVHWLADVMDTCATFRNIQSMPFMAWSREINDYIYKDFFLSENKLYRLTPDLIEEPYTNDSIKNHVTRLLENFKIINSYVCNNNKIYPAGQNALPGNKTLLLNYSDSLSKNIFTKSADTVLMPEFPIPEEYKYLYAEVSADVNLASPDTEGQPSFRLALINKKKTAKNYLYWSKRDIVLMTKSKYMPKKWNYVSTNDMFTLDDYKNYNNTIFELALYNGPAQINLKMKNLKLIIYGIK